MWRTRRWGAKTANGAPPVCSRPARRWAGSMSPGAARGQFGEAAEVVRRESPAFQQLRFAATGFSSRFEHLRAKDRPADHGFAPLKTDLFGRRILGDEATARRHDEHHVTRQHAAQETIANSFGKHSVEQIRLNRGKHSFSRNRRRDGGRSRGVCFPVNRSLPSDRVLESTPKRWLPK